MATYGTFVDAVTLKASEANDFLVWKTFTPVIRQPSSLSFTGSGPNRYCQVNKLVIAVFTFGPSLTGTSNTRIEIDMPVTAAAGSGFVIGGGYFIRSSPFDIIRITAVQFSTTRIALYSDAANSTTAYFGTTAGGGTTTAGGDSYKVVVMYKAA
jgi:hypothetical protein